MKESNIQRLIMLALSKEGLTVFRNNTGVGYQGDAVRFNRTETIRVNKGNVLIRNARMLHAGLTVGSSDIIGWQSINITPDMVGKRIAVFTAVEVKTPKGRISEAQKQFLDAVKNSGGIAEVMTSDEDVILLRNVKK